MRSLSAGFAFLLALGAAAGCGTAEPDCGCRLQVGDERRTLACGESACVAGVLALCDGNAQIVERGACSDSGAASSGQATGTTPPEPAEPAPRACAELLGFCNGSCTAPASVSADCQATASAGDDDACARWTLTNGVLCRP